MEEAIVRHFLMARAYSNDLRHKLLSAYDKGQGSLSGLAGRFGVSRGWAWKISAHRTRTGSNDQPVYRHGSKSRVDEKALMELLRAQPDATLAQLQSVPNYRAHSPVARQRVSLAIVHFYFVGLGSSGPGTASVVPTTSEGLAPFRAPSI